MARTSLEGSLPVLVKSRKIIKMNPRKWSKSKCFLIGQYPIIWIDECRTFLNTIFLKIFGEFWVFWNSKILIILRLKFFHSGTSDSVMNKMTSNDSRMTQIWPKIDILMTCLNFISRWSVDWMKPDIDAIELTKYVPMKPTHWFIDTMIYWIFHFFLLKGSQKGLPDRTSYHLAVFYEDGTAKACTESYFWFISEILMVKNTLFIHKWPSLKSSKVDQVLFVSLLFYIWAPRNLHCWHVTSDYPITTSKLTGMANLLLFDSNLAHVPSIFDECAFRGTVVCGTARTGIHLDFGYSSKWFYFRILNYCIILTS